MKQMKKQIAISMFAILLIASTIAFALAEDVETGTSDNESNLVISPNPTSTELNVPESELTIPENETVGITPDSTIGWGLKRAWERVTLALTLGKAAKAQKGLEHAQSRLLEIRQMLAEKKFAAANKSIEAYKADMEQVRARIQELKDEKNPKNELKEKLKLQAKLERLQDTEDKLETTVQVKVFGNLSEQQQEQVNQMVEMLQNNSARATVWMTDAITGAKIRIKARDSLSDENLSEVVTEYEDALNLSEIRARQLNASIARLEKIIAVKTAKIESLEEAGKNVTFAREKLGVTQDLLEKLKELQSTGDYSNIKEIVKEAKIDAREIEIDKRAVRNENAAQVIANVIQKMEDKQIETGQNLTNAIAKLTLVQSKLQTRAETLKSNIGTSVETD